MNTDVVNEEKETSTTPDEFDQARALIISYALEKDADDARLPQILTTVREMCPTTFNRILVLLAAADDERFHRYGLADAVSLVRNMEITADVMADKERLLEAMHREDTAIEQAARREAAEECDLYRQAAVRLLTKFREPNWSQVEWELRQLWFV